jgi:hypothetical protein
MKWSGVNFLYLIFFQVLLRTVKEKEKQKTKIRKRSRTKQKMKNQNPTILDEENADPGGK